MSTTTNTTNSPLFEVSYATLTGLQSQEKCPVAQQWPLSFEWQKLPLISFSFIVRPTLPSSTLIGMPWQRRLGHHRRYTHKITKSIVSHRQTYPHHLDATALSTKMFNWTRQPILFLNSGNPLTSLFFFSFGVHSKKRLEERELSSVRGWWRAGSRLRQVYNSYPTLRASFDLLHLRCSCCCDLFRGRKLRALLRLTLEWIK